MKGVSQREIGKMTWLNSPEGAAISAPTSQKGHRGGGGHVNEKG